MILTFIKYCEEISMYLVYIYNSLIFNLFLTFLLLWHLCGYKVSISSWTFVWEDQGAVHVRTDMLKACWPWHAEEPNMAKQFR